MIIINSCKNYKCLSSLIIILLNIYPSFCSNKINDYIIKNIAYGKNRDDIVVDLEYDKTIIFDIKDYDIDKIRPNSNIKLIKNLQFHARALSPKIFQFLIVDKNQKRFMPPLIDPEFKLNLIKEKNEKKEIKIKVYYAKEYTPMQKEVLGFLRKQTYDENNKITKIKNTQEKLKIEIMQTKHKLDLIQHMYLRAIEKLKQGKKLTNVVLYDEKEDLIKKK